MHLAKPASAPARERITISLPEPGTMRACFLLQEVLDDLSCNLELDNQTVLAITVNADEVSDGGVIGTVRLSHDPRNGKSWSWFQFFADGTVERHNEHCFQQKYDSWQQALFIVRSQIVYLLGKQKMPRLDLIQRYERTDYAR